MKHTRTELLPILKLQKVKDKSKHFKTGFNLKKGNPGVL